MARPATIDDEQLLERLSRVFRELGFDGASVAALSQATCLKKASLYHRFPDGKEQMAREVLAAALAWLDEHVLTPLRADAPPHARVAAVATQLDKFYSGGKQACLLNMLAAAQSRRGPFTKQIKAAFTALIEALAAAALDAGLDARTARHRAERVVTLLQGSLVLARGLGTTRPFRDFLRNLPDELLGTDAKNQS